MTLMKCITLKYLTKRNCYPYSIQIHVLLIKILMTFNISWVALKFFWHNSNKWNKNLKQNKYLYQIIWILIIVLLNLLQLRLKQLYKPLENIYKVQKSIFLLGDFSVNLLNYNDHNQTNEFLNSLASNSFIPVILQPTRITSHSNTLIDNIFSNVIDPGIISGNLIATISDHLPQLATFSNMCGNILGNK